MRDPAGLFLFLPEQARRGVASNNTVEAAAKQRK
jgi:hypothetical protein